MSNCKNCLSHIRNKNEKVICAMCDSPMHEDCSIKEGDNFYCDMCYTVKEEDGGRIEFEIPKIIRRSYIETFRSCPFKFYHEVILGNKQPDNPYAKVGQDLHDLFDKYCKSPYEKNVMMDEYRMFWEEYSDELFDNDKNLMGKLEQKCIDSIDTFYDVVKDMPKAISSEEKFIFDVGDDLPQVSTTIDRINEVDGELEIVDWKTGAMMVGQKLSSDLQVPLYIYGVKQKYQKPIRKFTLYYLQENKIREFNSVDEDNYICTVNKRQYKVNITDAIKEVQSVFQHIKRGNFNIPMDTRKMYYTCKMCHLRDKVCAGAEIQGWREING